MQWMRSRRIVGHGKVYVEMPSEVCACVGIIADILFAICRGFPWTTTRDDDAYARHDAPSRGSPSSAHALASTSPR